MTTIGKGQVSDNQLYWVAENKIASDFPELGSALRDPDGLLAIGGDLSIKRLLSAYQKGIFPWYSDGQPILWWSPDPRCVLEPDQVKISRSLNKTLRKNIYQITFNTAFADVIKKCAETRKDNSGTWITQEMMQAYIQLHEQGFAVSVEAWHEGELVGGLYGVAIDRVFFGESMFSRKTDSSKVALVALARTIDALGFRMIDCQVHSHHLQSLGAKPVARELFSNILGNFASSLSPVTNWPVGVLE
ncbi:MAG: leucyl/phenylalanyl-tRNA--protein transferase [Gammaproteobacteria bacterium]|nr:leucyl/phenylalanyl-tRNA--protein transferase [Gammaproteobacteria bacterium]